MTPESQQPSAHQAPRQHFIVGPEGLSVECTSGAAARYAHLGRELLGQGKFDEAAVYLQATVAAWMHTASPDADTRFKYQHEAALATQDLARAYVAMKKFSHASAALDQCLPHFRDNALKFPREALEALSFARVIQEKDGDFLRACTIQREIITIIEATSKQLPFDLIRPWSELAALADQSGDKHAASLAMGSVFHAIERVPEKEQKKLIHELVSLAWELTAAGRQQEASKLTETIIALRRALGAIVDIHDISIARLQSAGCAMVGDYQHAAHHQERALSIVESRYGPADPQAIGIREQFARLLFVSRQPTKAEMLSTRNLNLISEHGNRFPPASVAAQMIEVAGFRLSNCKVLEAEGLLEQACKLLAHDERNYPISYYIVRGGTHAIRGEIAEGLAATAKAEDMLRSMPPDGLQASLLSVALYRKAQLRLACGDIDDAADAIDELDLITATLPAHASRLQADILSLRGQLAAARGDEDESNALHQEALAEIHSNPALNNTISEVPHLIHVAHGQSIRGRYEEAQTLLERARHILDDTGRASHVLKLQVLAALENAYSALGLSDEAAQSQGEYASTLSELQFLNDGTLFLEGGDMLGM